VANAVSHGGCFFISRMVSLAWYARRWPVMRALLQSLPKIAEISDISSVTRRCLEVTPDDKAVAKLLDKAERSIKAAEAKQKKMFGKMFG
jgi:hypothetical protein